MMQILADKPHSGRCGFPISIRGPVIRVRAVEFCKATGEVDLVLWLADQGYDTNALKATPVMPVRVALETNPHLARPVLWTYGGSGTWTSATSIELSSLIVTDFPEILVIHGDRARTSLPTLPTPPAAAVSQEAQRQSLDQTF